MPATVRLLHTQWQGCAAHKLQLLIKASLQEQPAVTNLIGHVHKIVGFLIAHQLDLFLYILIKSANPIHQRMW